MPTRTRSLEYAVITAAKLLAVVVAVSLLGFALPGGRRLGIEPRTLSGLVGIVFAPLLHADHRHLLANAAPLFVLLILLFWDQHYRPARTLAMIWLAAGAGTWLVGRSGTVHLGASLLVYGLMAYLVVSGVLMRSWRSAIVALVVVLLFGGILAGVLPQRGHISWEGHLCGMLAGVWAAYHNHD